MNRKEAQSFKAEIQDNGRKFVFTETKTTTLHDADPLKIAQSLRYSWEDTVLRASYFGFSTATAIDGIVRTVRGDLFGSIELIAGAASAVYILRGWSLGTETRLWMQRFVNTKLRERITSEPALTSSQEAVVETQAQESA